MIKLFKNIFRRKFRKIDHQDDAISEKLNLLSKKLKYRFQYPDFLVQALKHRSHLSITNEARIASNERLELLGDAVLGLIVTNYLYHKFPKKDEGELTTMKSIIVSRETLANSAANFSLGDFLFLNEAEERAGGRERTSILADAFEALIGAIFLDGGIRNAGKVINRLLLHDFSHIINEEKNRNYKSLLLEYSQSMNLGLPLYRVQNEEGPDHKKLFTIEVRIQDHILGRGKGSSKKIAEQNAAQSALKKLLLL
ncbi:ribonuclease III [candidate division KSB1 bacterium]|nr:ribonuclease III [candidate division KSB1 bacterium]